MAQSISIPGVVGLGEKVGKVAGNVVAGVNQVASGQGVTGAPEKSAIAGGSAAAAPAPNSWTGIISGFHANNFLVRLLKIVVGGTLLIAGIMRMSGMSEDKLGVVTQTAAKLSGI